MEHKNSLENKLKFSPVYEKKWYFSLNLIWNLLVYFLITSFILSSFISANDVVKANNTLMNYILAILGISILLIIYTFLNFMSIWSLKFSMFHFKEKIFYALISLNIVRLGFVVNKAIKLNFLKFKIQRWRIIDITLMGLTIAALLTLKAVDNLLPPIPPLFISLSLYQLALFFFVFITGSFLKTLFVGTISGFLFLLFPSTTFLTFLQFLFDYVIPSACFSLSFFIVFKAEDRKTKLQAMQLIVFVVIPFIFVLLSRIIAGVLFWNQGSWTGVSVWLFSTIINSINTGFDTILSLILVPLIISPLWFLKDKYEQINNR